MMSSFLWLSLAEFLLVLCFVGSVDITEICNQVSNRNDHGLAASSQIYKACPYSTDAKFISGGRATTPKVGDLSNGNWLLLGGCNEQPKVNCTWLIRNSEYTLVYLYYDVFVYNKTVIYDGHCQKSIPQFICEYGNYKIRATNDNFFLSQSFWPYPFQMRIFYELYTKGCFQIVDIDIGDNIVPYFRSKDFPRKFTGSAYCTWYIPTYKYPNDIYLIIYEYKLRPFYGSQAYCWTRYGSLWATNFTKQNEARIMWKRCSSTSKNIEVVKINGKQTPWLSINFYSPDVETYNFHAGGFYSQSNCGGVVTKGFEKIDFLFDKGYGDNRFCTWIINPLFEQEYFENANTFIIFHYFRLEYSAFCSADYVRFLTFDYKTKDFVMHHKDFCGRKEPTTQVVDAQHVAIQFKSDISDDDIGFSATVIQTWSDCGRVLYVNKPKTMSSRIYVNGDSKLCSWFFYADSAFYLTLNVDWLYSRTCGKTNLRIYDLSEKNYEKSRANICKDGTFKIFSKKTLVQFFDNGSSGFTEVLLSFSLKFHDDLKSDSSTNLFQLSTSMIPQSSMETHFPVSSSLESKDSTSSHTSSSTVTSHIQNTSQHVSSLVFSTSQHVSSPASLSTQIFLQSVSPSLSSRISTTLIINAENKQGDGETNFGLYAGIIASIMVLMLSLFVFIVVIRRRKRNSGIKRNQKLESSVNNNPNGAVFYEHRSSRITLVNNDSNSLEAKSDNEPFVNIGKTGKKSFREKLKSSFGKEIVDIGKKFDDDSVVNKSYNDSGDECELYESNEDSFSAIPRVSYSRAGNPLYSLYGIQPGQNEDENDGDDDIFLPKNQVIPAKKEPLTRSERESTNSLYGMYAGSELSDVPSIPDVDEIKKKKQSLESCENNNANEKLYMDDENIYAPANIYASSNNPLYGRTSNVSDKSDVNQYYVPSEATNISRKSTKKKDPRYSEAPKIVEEDNYACPDSPVMKPIPQEQEYSYAANPRLQNIEANNMLYEYHQPNITEDNALYE